MVFCLRGKPGDFGFLGQARWFFGDFGFLGGSPVVVFRVLGGHLMDLFGLVPNLGEGSPTKIGKTKKVGIKLNYSNLSTRGPGKGNLRGNPVRWFWAFWGEISWISLADPKTVMACFFHEFLFVSIFLFFWLRLSRGS